MIDIIAITVPIYLLIGLGFVLVRRGIFDRADLRILGRFVLIVALPALLFRALSTRPVAEVMNPGYLGAMSLGSVAMFAIVFVVARRMRGRSEAQAAMLAAGTCFPNSVYIGYPILLQLIGPTAGVALALNLVVENLLLLPLLLALAEGRQGHGGARAVRHALAGLLRNPMIIAIVAGFAAALLQWPLPAPLVRTIDIAAGAVAAIGLVVIGGSLVGQSTQGLVREVTFIATAKLLVHPVAVYGALWLMPPVEPTLRLGAVAMAAMPMFGIYPVLAQKYGLEGRAAAAMLGATVASFFTITALLGLLTSSALPWPS